MRTTLLVLFFLAAIESSGANIKLARAATVGQTDDFEDRTTQGWMHGSPASSNPPVNVSTDGPDGVNDAYLNVSASGGFGAGSRLLALNSMQWTGNYVFAGIDTIVADVRNPGPDPLELRVAFNGVGGWFASSNPIMLAASSGWQSVTFAIDQSALFAVGGGAYADTMTGVSEMRILHSTTPAFQGDKIDAEFHVDNLRAVPEPGSIAMAMLCGLAVGGRFWRCRQI